MSAEPGLLDTSSCIILVARRDRLAHAIFYTKLLRRELHDDIYSAIAIACRQIEQPEKYRTYLTADVVTGNLDVRSAGLEMEPDALER